MQALIYHGPDRKQWESKPDPKLEHPADAIVQIDTATICGTDLHILKGDVPTCTPGRTLGHEAVGTVVETGDAVENVRQGDRVLVSCISACGRCRYCREGMYGQCQNGGGWILGHLIDGTQAELTRIPFADNSLYKVPEGLSDEQVLFLSDILPTGFEVGVHSWDHVAWQDQVAAAGAGWTEGQMRRACERFAAIFGERPRVHGAAGWQMNADAYRLEPQLGFAYASDTRGREPFLPVSGGETIVCPQLPTTLPTLDELIGVDGLTAQDVADRVLALSRNPPPSGHVFTLHAELEGMKLAGVFERLLEGWQALGYRLVALRSVAEALHATALPRCRVVNGEIRGRSGRLSLQGETVDAS